MLVCGDLGKRVARGGREGLGGLAALRSQCQGVPVAQEALVAQQCCPLWDPVDLGSPGALVAR